MKSFIKVFYKINNDNPPISIKFNAEECYIQIKSITKIKKIGNWSQLKSEIDVLKNIWNNGKYRFFLALENLCHLAGVNFNCTCGTKNIMLSSTPTQIHECKCNDLELFPLYILKTKNNKHYMALPKDMTEILK